MVCFALSLYICYAFLVLAVASGVFGRKLTWLSCGLSGSSFSAVHCHLYQLYNLEEPRKNDIEINCTEV